MRLKVAGVDEAGRGPLAGPVVAAAVILPDGYSNSKIKDSKKLSERSRDILFKEIIEISEAYSICAVGHHRIDLLNIREATKLAMTLAVNRVNPDLALIDGNMRIDVSCDQRTIVGGDALELAISAASILAKVWRDQLMKKLGVKYPGYGLEIHSGYPTAAHRLAVNTIGPSPVHRKSFAGIGELTAKLRERELLLAQPLVT